jgi:hypothetical protein
MIVVISFLPGYDRPGWREKAGAIGTLVIGVGTATSFIGTAEHLNHTSLAIFTWALFGFALLLICAILAPYKLPGLRLGKNKYAAKKQTDADYVDHTRYKISINVTTCKYPVHDQPAYERATTDKVSRKAASPFTETNKPGCESHPVETYPSIGKLDS